MKDVTIVVGTIGQSIMRSEDNGQTWARIGPRRGFAYEASVRCIAMQPRQPTILFAGTERGLYRSEDRGANWQYIDSALNPHYIWAIGIDPVNPDNMFVGTGTPTPAMLFRSKDGGRTWEKRPAEIAAECEAVGTPRFTGIAVDPVEPKHIWVGLEVDGARHSSDGGETWELVEVTGHKDIHNVAVTAGPPKTVFIMANREIYASIDNGATWETRGMQTNLPWEYPRKETYLRGIAVDSADPKGIFLGFGDFTPGSSGAIARSRDLGKSWKLLPLPVQPNSTVWTFGTNRADPNILFAASRYGYLYRSDDGGASWEKLRRELSEIAAMCWLPN
jgi:photosystem II stability/assembly factor-like uncharacterized protein